MMPDALQSLLARPDLPRLARATNETLQRERVRRERFRRELTPSVKAEFIGGEIVMHSPTKAKHLRATQNLVGLLWAFVQRHGLGEVFSEKALICLTRNDYEPDVVFFEKAKADGFSADQMEFPAPDFIAEVLSESTEQRDRGVKFDDYADHGVAEYWSIDCDEASIEQYSLRDGVYQLAQTWDHVRRPTRFELTVVYVGRQWLYQIRHGVPRKFRVSRLFDPLTDLSKNTHRNSEGTADEF